MWRNLKRVFNHSKCCLGEFCCHILSVLLSNSHAALTVASSVVLRSFIRGLNPCLTGWVFSYCRRCISICATAILLFHLSHLALVSHPWSWGWRALLRGPMAPSVWRPQDSNSDQSQRAEPQGTSGCVSQMSSASVIHKLLLNTIFLH